jgi:hypothetical protein
MKFKVADQGNSALKCGQRFGSTLDSWRVGLGRLGKHHCCIACRSGLRIALLLAVSVSVLSISTSHAVPRNDHDGDGYSDPTLISIQSGGALDWNTLSGSNLQPLLQVPSFGAVGDNITLAPWLSKTQALYGVVTLRSGKIVWRVRRADGQVSERAFGSSGDTAVSGADFDGNGIADAATISRSGSKLSWTIKRNLFKPSSATIRVWSGGRWVRRTLPSTATLRFGNSSDLVFYADPDGKGDWMGVIQNGDKLVYRNVYTGRVRRFSLVGFGAGSLGAMPLKQTGAPDLLVFPIRSGGVTNIYVTTFGGSLVAQTQISSTGDIILGNFTSTNNPQIAVQGSEGNYFVFTPATGETVNIQLGTGIPVDAININKILPPGETSREYVENPPPVGSSLESICTTITKMNRDVLYKPGSGGTNDSRTGKPAFLWYDCTTQDPGVRYLHVLASNGAVVGKFELYPVICPLVRFYTGYGSGSMDSGSSLMAKAIAASGSKKLYFYTQNGNCWGPVNNANGRSGGR